MSLNNPIKKALTIAGSDSSGGAGIQADLKTFSRLRVYGMSVITAITAQNTHGVVSVAEVAPEVVSQQLEAVLSDIPPDAAKIGMLFTAGVVEAVAHKIKQYAVANVILDPVMVSTSGATLLNTDAIATFKRSMLPLADLIAPNLSEASALTGAPVSTLQDMNAAAMRIHQMGAKHVLIKGGHLEADHATDVFFDGVEVSHLRSPRLAAGRTHGTGCVLSAAIAAYCALGKPLKEAVPLGKEFVTAAIAHAIRVGGGASPCDPLSLT